MDTNKRQTAGEIYKLAKNLTITLQVLVSDIQYAEERLRNEKQHEQFWRRVIIRSVCALGEATLNVLKGLLPKSAEFFQVVLTDYEIAILTELQKTADGQTKPFFMPLNKNLKETFKLFGKIHGVQLEIKADQGYQDFCDTYNLRNKLMHPRKHIDLAISDDDYKSSIRGWNWFNTTLVAALQQCGEKLPFHLKRK